MTSALGQSLTVADGDVDLLSSLAEFRRLIEKQKVNGWLRANLARARLSALSDAQLVEQVRDCICHDDLDAVLDAVTLLLDRGQFGAERELGNVTAALSRHFIQPGRDAVAVDRVIRRILPRLSRQSGSSTFAWAPIECSASQLHGRSIGGMASTAGDAQ